MISNYFRAANGRAPVQRLGIAVALAATALGALQAMRLGMPTSLGGAQVPASEAVVRALGIWWLWALLAPIVFAVARRWHPERVGVWRSVAAHSVGAVAVSMMHSFIYVPAILALVWPELLPRLDFVWRVNLVGNIAGDLVPYAALAGLYYALDFYRARQRGLADIPVATSYPPPVQPPQWLDRIAIRLAGRVTFVPVRDIDWIEGSGDYVLLHCGERRFLAGERLGALASALDPTAFVRAHRSAIVRIDRVRDLKPRTHGDYDIVLADGRTVRCSRTYREAVVRALAPV